MNEHPFKSWIEISEAAVRANIKSIRSLLRKETKLFSVVKSNAYGHGLRLFSALAAGMGVDGFCVDSVIEGMKLRRDGITLPILVLGTTFPNLLADAEQNDITITISSFDALKEYEAHSARPRFHIKVDTGMHRHGFLRTDIEGLLSLLLLSNFRDRCAGLYTHFAAAKDPANTAFTEAQNALFMEICDLFSRAGITGILRHASATGGTLLGEKYHHDAVRVGIGLYGVSPSKELAAAPFPFELIPALSWRGLIAEVKTIEAGEKIGYDTTYTTLRKTVLAVIPVGYWHGLPWAFSNIGWVTIRGERAPILGRVCMDIMMVDVTHIPSVRRGDVVTFIGEDISAASLAEVIHGSTYELLTRLNPLIYRSSV